MNDKQRRANAVAAQLEHFVTRLRSGEYDPESFRLEGSTWVSPPGDGSFIEGMRPGPHTKVEFTIRDTSWRMTPGREEWSDESD